MSSERSQIGFGRIRHARLRPVRHEFAYPAFFLRLPLRSLARQRAEQRWLRFNRPGLFAIHDADHGDGGPLLDWIDALLAREGIDDARGEIWLHTFPRVAGYAFNPVSFWLAHRVDDRLRAVVCEVNNTFGERHCYLLAHADGRPLAWGEEIATRKVFHVSPFCAVEGSYRFRLMLTGPERPRFVARIDHDDREGPLLQTAIAGALEPLTDRALALALLRYPLFTSGVITRIHWQALRLWLKRVPFHPKPAAPAHPVTR
jgi:DUF1365 family protein